MRERLETIFLVRIVVGLILSVGIFVFDWRILVLLLLGSIWFLPLYLEAVFFVLLYTALYSGNSTLSGLVPTGVTLALVCGVTYVRRRLRLTV